MTDEIKEALAAHELFRLLGFSADDIYLQKYAESGVGGFGVALVYRGEKYTIHINDVCPIDLIAQWKEAVRVWNRMTDGEKRVVANASRVFKDKVMLMANLLKAGVHFPIASN